MDTVKLVFHKFFLGDCDDVEIYAAHPIYEWLQTDAGKWCKEHSKDLHWLTGHDQVSYGYRISIIGTLKEEDATFYNLKWGMSNAPK
jgi:hypothetical protein